MSGIQKTLSNRTVVNAVAFGIILLIFRVWFFTGDTLSSGDWPYLYAENIQEFRIFEPPFIWLEPYYRLTAKLGMFLGLSWELSERLFWFFPFVFLVVYSSYQLTKSWIGSLIYSTNPYILMIVGGGQMGVALAYAMAPLVLYRIMLLQRNAYRIQMVNAGAILAVQLMFDPRISLLTAGIIFLWMLFNRAEIRTVSKTIITVAFALILNLFWIIPLVQNPEAANIDELSASKDAVEYYSVARFPQAFSLLHPNWPENIFGKVYLMRWEYLFVPIIAFSGLLFISRTQHATVKSQNHNEKFKTNVSAMQQFHHKTIHFFIVLALLGAFLAKGINEPFGILYQWIFLHVPGFVVFRDPTKFYVLVALSYSVLIPYSLFKVRVWLNTKFDGRNSEPASRQGGQIQNIILLLFMWYWLLLIRPAWAGELPGTFQPKPVPEEYVVLKNYLQGQDEFFRTVWIPQMQRFGFNSDSHPALDSSAVTGSHDLDMSVSWFRNDIAHESVKNRNIRYVIVPYDAYGELFMSDYEYCGLCRQKAVNALENIPWMARLESFRDNAVFMVKDSDREEE